MGLYTSIFAPISILATNSLITQIFHIQTEIPELFFTSILMFLPIAFIIRNYVSIIVYGIGTIIYAIGVASGSLLLVSENMALLNTIMIALPLIIYNIVNYIYNREDKKNILLWVINIVLATLLVFSNEIFRVDVIIIYVYMIYFITQTLFGKNNSLSRIISLVFTGWIIISCIDSEMCGVAEYLEFGFDTLFITVMTGGFIYLSQAYKNSKEYFIFTFIILLQYIKMPSEILFIFVNIIAIGYGVYKIIVGNRENSYKQIMQGVSLILLLILFRFINFDLDFISKSIMFLVTGAIFIISANVMKKRIGEKIDE